MPDGSRRTVTTNPSLVEVLLPAYHPCPGFSGACGEMRWDPANGHVPRGFAGALGRLEDVSLVLVTAEPGDPYPGEAYPPSTADKVLKAAEAHVRAVLANGTDLYHRNLRYILDGCFPSLPFREQMKRTWITDAVLCSATKEGGSVSAICERECRKRYLEKQLELLPDALVVALGGKARTRLRDWPGVISAYSVAPPGAKFKRARPSWDAVIAEYHARFG